MQDIILSQIYNLIQNGYDISTDSRNINKNTLYFALKGEKFDGNTFALNALDGGAAYAIVDNPHIKHDRLFFVENVLDCLQKLAKFHRTQLNIPVIGITGTNGKTTTKELIYSVLSQKYNVFATKGNFNNHIGVPLMLLGIKQTHEIAVIEMGANHIGEIAELCEMVKPTHGIITNIGKAHLEGFKNVEGVIKTKKALYEAVENINGTVFVNKDDSLLMELSKNLNRICYSQLDKSSIMAEIIKDFPFLTLNAQIDKCYELINTKLYGTYNINNLLASISIGHFFGVENKQIKKALESYTPNNNRSQLKETSKNILLLDAYNANPSSMELAVKGFNKMAISNKALILGEMKELGAESVFEHTKLINLISDLKLEHIFLVGDIFLTIEAKEFKVFKNVYELKKHFEVFPIKNKTILIKGSRSIQLENLIDVL